MSESREVRFTVYGNPIAKQRARTCRLPNGFTRSYTPSETMHAEATVQEVVQQLLRTGQAQRLEGALEVELVFFRALPKSVSKRKREAMLAGALRPVTKPDWDNLGKLITDALNELLYLDDAAITDAIVRKRYSDTPRTEVVLREVGAEPASAGQERPVLLTMAGSGELFEARPLTCCGRSSR